MSHIGHYAEMANPLYQLTGSKPRGNRFQWLEEHQLAFGKIKKLLVSAPILGFPIEGVLQFILHPDASDSSLGADLIQIGWEGGCTFLWELHFDTCPA